MPAGAHIRGSIIKASSLTVIEVVLGFVEALVREAGTFRLERPRLDLGLLKKKKFLLIID